MKFTLKNFIIAAFIMAEAPIFAFPTASKDSEKGEADRQTYTIYNDNGVMRRSDTKEEVSYYGTNYTVPFAHAYRMLGYSGKDRKEAIKNDIHHMKRLGFNGFRLHLWDAELADSLGNLLSNDHLDLLDYMIAELEKNGIDIILTAQTNFGNGYPEKDIDTGAFTYDFEKCKIHDDPRAQKIQERYLKQLASHVNPYTKLSYGADRAIIAMEINNEPCHSGNKKEVTVYINRMAKALRKGGFDKMVIYNVSHNPQVTEAYYDADIDGTTYQWYPDGLVAGHERKGNFLPTVDSYDIPWKETMKRYEKLPRIVYEFDPGDLLYSYMYPAIARTFRKEGFQWITQFAYDPTDIAQFNTEYQTHYLNLAYTPAKALSMLIAGEVARGVKRGEDFGTYPNDTTFGDFRVSYVEDLSEMNSPEKFYYTNTTSSIPADANSLRHIAGHGSSPVVEYEGTGAYFLDREPDSFLWRLEVMPDVMLVEDPFEKPSPTKEVGKIVYRDNPMRIVLPQLGNNYYFESLTEANRRGRAADGAFEAYPGVYLLSPAPITADQTASVSKTFAAPAATEVPTQVVHTPRHYVPSVGDIDISAQVFGSIKPDKVEIYPSSVSFWRNDNKIYEMTPGKGYSYTAKLPADATWGDDLSYNIVVWQGDSATTFPEGVKGTPLDWDANTPKYYTSRKATPGSPLVLLKPMAEDPNIDTAMIPEAWDFRFTFNDNTPIEADSYSLQIQPETDGYMVMKRYVGDEIADAPNLKGKKQMMVKIGAAENLEGAEIALIGKNGVTYSAPLKSSGEAAVVDLSDLRQRSNLIVPAPYPTFLKREIEVGPMPMNAEEIDFVELIIPTHKGKSQEVEIEGIWLE